MSSEEGILDLLPRVERIARGECFKRRLSRENCEDFQGQVRLHLWQNGQAAYRQWIETGRKTSYLVRLVKNIAVDLWRQEAGRRQHSRPVARAGYWAMRLEALHRWDGHHLAAAIRIVQDNEGCALSASELEALAEVLPQTARRKTVGEEALDAEPASQTRSDPEAHHARQELACRIANAVNRGIREIGRAEDRFLLRSVFYKGLTVTAVARSLGIDRRKAYSRIESLCRRKLRKALAREHLELDTVVAALEDGLPELAVDWHRLEGGSGQNGGDTP